MERERLERLRKLSILFDSQFPGPFGFRFGLDGIIGLIPFAGDVITSAVAIYIIAEAAALGAPPSVLIRMAINLTIESVIDIIPFFGNLFDFVWQSNTKNIVLLEKYLENPVAESKKSRIIVGLIIFVLIAIFIISCVLTYEAFRLLFNWIETLHLFSI